MPTRHCRLWILFSALLAACQTVPAVLPTTATPRPVQLRIEASTAAQPLLAATSAIYHADRPEVTFQTQAANDELALEALHSGRVDGILMTGTPGPGDWSLPVALDGVAVIVARDNPIPQLTLAQVRELFQGRTDSWAQLEVNLAAVVVLSREDGSAMRTLFEEKFMSDAHVTLTAMLVTTDADMVNAVAGNPTAIGYASMSALTRSVRAVPIEGVLPTPHTVAEGSYPAIAPVFFVSRMEPGGPLRDFISFLISPKGQAIIGEKYGRVK